MKNYVLAVALEVDQGIISSHSHAVHYELLKSAEMVTGDRYQQQLIKLNQALKRKRPRWGDRTHKVIFLHNNSTFITNNNYNVKTVKIYLQNVE